MFDQLLISGLFGGLFFGLIFTKWPAERVFVCAMLAAYFAGLVDTSEVLDKATNTGVVTLILLLLVSIGLEKLSWLSRLSNKLIVRSYSASLLRIGIATAFFPPSSIILLWSLRWHIRFVIIGSTPHPDF